MKDPVCRVAPERGGPSRKRRPSRLFGIGHNNADAKRRPQSVACHWGRFAAQRPNKNGALARRDADGRCGGKQSDDKAVAPSAQRRQSKRMRVRRPHDKKRGKSACGSAQETPHPQGAQRERVRLSTIPAHLQRAVRPAPASVIVTGRPRRQGRLGGANPRRRVGGIERGAGLPAGVKMLTSAITP